MAGIPGTELGGPEAGTRDIYYYGLDGLEEDTLDSAAAGDGPGVGTPDSGPGGPAGGILGTGQLGAGPGNGPVVVGTHRPGTAVGRGGSEERQRGRICARPTRVA